MNDSVRSDEGPRRLAINRGVAALFVLLSAWSLYRRLRHPSERFVPTHPWLSLVFPGTAGLAVHLLIDAGVVVLMFALLGQTEDRMEKACIVACLASAIIEPLKVLFPAYAVEIGWANLGLLLAFLLSLVAVLVRLSRSTTARIP